MQKGKELRGKKTLLRKDFGHFEEMNTRWKDMDAIGHVNNATYLTYLESARIKFVTKKGIIQGRASEVPFIVASIKIDFLKPLVHPAAVFVGQKIVRVGNTSFDLLSGIFKNDEESPSATALTTLVCFDYKVGKAIPVPEVIRKELGKRPL